LDGIDQIAAGVKEDALSTDDGANPFGCPVQLINV
jgi:hypothetical protein